MVRANEVVQAIVGRSDWREELVAQEAATAQRLTDAYSRLLPRIEQSQQDLTDALALEVAHGAEIDARLVRGRPEYERLLVTIDAEMRDFARLLNNEMSRASDNAIVIGMNGALNLANALSGQRPGILGSVWVRPDPAMLRQLVDYMDSAGMQRALSRFGDNATRDISDLILGFAAQGKNPRFIARAMTEWNSVPYSWADNMARTVQIYSARTSSHASYVANEDILEGWMWVSAADGRTCISCWSKHGSVYDFKQTLNDHHRGRCTEAPIVKGTTWAGDFVTGPELFTGLPVDEQRGIMGQSMHDAWKRGEVDWGDFSVPYQNDIYGEMQRAASLSEIQRRRAG